MSSSSSSRSFKEGDKSRTMLHEAMGDQDFKLYEYLFRHEDEEGDDSGFLDVPPTVTTTSCYQEEDEEDVVSPLNSPSVVVQRLQQELQQTQEALRHQQNYTRNLERQFDELRTPAGMTRDASERFLEVLEDVKVKHSIELEECRNGAARERKEARQLAQAQLEACRQGFQGERVQLEKKILELQKELRQVQSHHKRDVRERSKQLEGCQQELLTCQDQLNHWKSQAVCHQREAVRLVQELQNDKKRLENFERDAENAKSMVETLRAELDRCQQELLACKEDLGREGMEKASLKHALQSAQNALDTDRQRHKVDVDRLTDELCLERETQEKLKRQHETEQHQWNALESQYLAKRSAKEQELTDRQHERDVLEGEVSNLRERLKKVESQPVEVLPALLGKDSIPKPHVTEHQNEESMSIVSPAESQSLNLSGDNQLMRRSLELGSSLTRLVQCSDAQETEKLVEEEAFVQQLKALSNLWDKNEQNNCIGGRPSPKRIGHANLVGDGQVAIPLDQSEQESCRDEGGIIDRKGDIFEQLEAVSYMLDNFDIHEYLEVSSVDEGHHELRGEHEATVPLAIFEAVHQRAERLEQEQELLLSETIDLLESARTANALEMDVFRAEMEQETERQVQEQVSVILKELEKHDLGGEALQKWEEMNGGKSATLSLARVTGRDE